MNETNLRRVLWSALGLLLAAVVLLVVSRGAIETRSLVATQGFSKRPAEVRRAEVENIIHLQLPSWGSLSDFAATDKFFAVMFVDLASHHLMLVLVPRSPGEISLTEA